MSGDLLHDLIACPTCGARLEGVECPACGAVYDEEDGVLRLGLPVNARVETVRRFYAAAPFPGYPPRDSLGWLRARAERSPFAQRLDAAIPGDARILEVGCGT